MASSFARTGLIAVLVTLFCFAGSASAATFTVNDETDSADGTCTADDAEPDSLRECINAADESDGEDTVVVPEGWYKLTLEGDRSEEDRGDLDVFDSETTTIDGSGDPRFTVIDANGIDRGVEVGGEASAAILDMTIRNGRVEDDEGAGVLVGNTGTLSLTRSLVIHNANVDDGDGGGISAQDAESLTLDQTLVERNSAEGDGGGVYLDGTDTAITDSTVDSNYAGSQGGGIYVDFSPLTLTRSSVNNNGANDDGGGIYNDNSFVEPQQGSALAGDEDIDTDIVNTTLSGNIADQDVSNAGDGGGIYNNEGRISILNATFADNQSNDQAFSDPEQQIEGRFLVDQGGAIWNEGDPVEFKNTILATSTTAGSYDPCGGDGFESDGNNLQTEDDPDCNFDSSMGDKVDADPRLARLADNGGSTRTRALLDGSEAIDAADNDACPDADQRGEPRPSGPACDIGAYERQPEPQPEQQPEQQQQQQQQPPPATTPQQQQPCTPAPPRSSISRSSLEIEDNTIRLTGRAVDFLCQGQDERGGIRRVRLAIALDVGSQCRFLRRNGNLGARRDCGSRRYINARLGTVRNGKVPWGLRLRGLDLPRGVYDMVALGTDRDGNNETRVRKFNHKRIRLR